MTNVDQNKLYDLRQTTRYLVEFEKAHKINDK